MHTNLFTPLSPLLLPTLLPSSAFPYGDEVEKRTVERMERKRVRDERRVNWAIGIKPHPPNTIYNTLSLHNYFRKRRINWPRSTSYHCRHNTSSLSLPLTTTCFRI